MMSAWRGRWPYDTVEVDRSLVWMSGKNRMQMFLMSSTG